MVNQVQIKGLDKRLLNRIAEDGFCDVLENLRPRGRKDAFYWEPMPQRSILTLGDSTRKGRASFELSAGADFQANTAYYIAITVNGRVISTTQTIADTGELAQQMVDLLMGDAEFSASFIATSKRVGTTSWKIELETLEATSVYNGTEFGFSVLSTADVLATGHIGIPSGIPSNPLTIGTIAQSSDEADLKVSGANDLGGLLECRLLLKETNKTVFFSVWISANADAFEVAQTIVNGIPESVLAIYEFDISRSTAGFHYIKMRSNGIGSQYNGSYLRLSGQSASGVLYEFSNMTETSGGEDPVENSCLESFTINGSVTVQVPLLTGDSQITIRNKIASVLQATAGVTANYSIDASSAPDKIFLSKLDAGKPNTTLAHTSLTTGGAINSGLTYTFVNATTYTIATNDAFRINGKPVPDATVQIQGGLNRQSDAPIYAFWQLRSGYGKFTLNPTAKLDRLITVHSDRIAIYEESDATAGYYVQSSEAHLIEQETFTVKSHATVDEVTMLTLLTDDKPVQFLGVVDDCVFDLKPPELPEVTVKLSYTHSDESKGLQQGDYYFVYAYELVDGQIISLSPVQPLPIMDIRDANKYTARPITLQFAFGAMPLGDTGTDYFWSKLIKKPVCYLTPKLSASAYFLGAGLAQGINSVFYQFMEKGEYVTDDITTAQRLPVDIINVNHTLMCNVVHSYNKRFVLGGLATDFVTPTYRDTKVHYDLHYPLLELHYVDDAYFPRYSALYEDPAVDPEENEFKIIVKIETENGVFYRESDSFKTTTRYPSPVFGTFQYPDRRCSQLLLLKKVSGAWQKYYEFKLNKSDTMNVAFLEIRNTYSTYPHFTNPVFSVEPIPINANTNAISYESRKVAMSDASNPYIFKGANVYRIGQYNNEIIQGFASNTLPISTGQYGEYPLYVFTNKSIWAMQQGAGEVAFASIQPISITEGALNSKSITNMAQVICFVSYQGVYLLANGRIELISQPINDVVDWNSVKNDVTIHYFTQSDIQEIWISTDSQTYIFSIEYATWHVLTRRVDRFFNGADNRLYSLSDSNLYREDSGSANESARIITRPILLGSLDQLKRLFNTFVRDSVFTTYALTHITHNKTLSLSTVYRGGKNTFRTHFGSAYAFIIEGTTQGMPAQENTKLELIQLEYETRYSHRIRN